MLIDELLEDYKVVGEYSFRLPTQVHVTKSKKKALNLNIYRNLHHYTLNTQKENFQDIVKKIIESLPPMQQVWLHYKIFAGSQARLDTMNVGSIVDKYFSDTLVNCNKIPDDNYNHVIFNSFSFGGVSKLNPYAEVTLYVLKPNTETKEETINMEVLFGPKEITVALTEYAEKYMPFTVTSVDAHINIGAEVNFNQLTPTDRTVNQKALSFDSGLPKAQARKELPTSETEIEVELEDSSQPVEKPKRKRRTKAEMEAARAAEAAAEEAGTNDSTEAASEGSDDIVDTEPTESTEGSAEESEAPVQPKRSLFDTEEPTQTEETPKDSDETQEEESSSQSMSIKPKKTRSIFDAN